MVPYVWAKPELKWDGFEPHAYFLDMENVWKLPLKIKSTGEPTTIGAVVEGFKDQKVETDDPVLDLTLKSESREVIVSGPHTHLVLVKLLYRFADSGVSPFDVRWFYFDCDNCREDPQTSYGFFLVAQDKIIDEHFTLSDWHNNGFDPAILSGYQSGPTWFHEPHWDEANDRFWYRKFYTETRTGQLMVLRPDEPTLFHYPEGRYRSVGGIEGWLGEIHRLVRGMRIAIWILVAIAVLELFLHWR